EVEDGIRDRDVTGVQTCALPIWVILLPVRLVGILVEDLLPAFSKEGWALLTTPGAAFYHRLNAPILIFELGGNSLLLVGSLILAVEFFRKRKRVPLMIVVLLLLDRKSTRLNS